MSTPTIAGVHHFSLTVPDIEKSSTWYAELFDLTEIMRESHDGGEAVVFAFPGFGLFVGLHRHDANGGESFEEIRTGLDHVSFGVADRAALEAWEKRLAERGVTYSPISDQPWGSVIVFRDLDGIQLELCAPSVAS